MPIGRFDNLPQPEDGDFRPHGRRHPVQPWEPRLPEPEPEPDNGWPEVDLIEEPEPEPLVTEYHVDNVRRLLAEKAKRRIEALRLYEPLSVQSAFHESKAPERVLRGSNRGGKTLPAAVEVARAVTGQDPFGKYPVRDGRAFLVGKDGRHICQVMYPKLFKARAFKIIRDEATGLWRAFRPWEAADAERETEAKAAPPLIPPRYVKEIAWENKREGWPSVVRLINGWEISFFSSLGKPPQGSDLDLVWLDEEIVDQEWYPEMAARLLDREGRFLWSATPQAGTDQLLELSERAESESLKTTPLVTEHVILLKDNPHIKEEAKDQLASKLSEQEKAVRIHGEFLLLTFKVYPEYSPAIHDADFFQIPRGWTRYVAIDPGRQVCAALFLAVPPADSDPCIYLYDELYIKECSAKEFGKQMRLKSHGQTFQAFLIDHQGARVTEMASGKTIEQQYSRALRHYKVSSISTGHHFIWASPDVNAGVEAFRDWLLIQDSGKPKVRVLKDRCSNWREEIKRYRYKRKAGIITNKPEDRGAVHLMACSRYLAMYDPGYVRPKEKKQLGGAIVEYRRRMAAKKEKRAGNAVTLGPVDRARFPTV